MTRIVNISGKDVLKRTALAKGEIKLKKSTVDAINTGRIEKGDVFSTAQMAGIMAVKNTPNLIPLCHNIPIEAVDISFEVGEEDIACNCEVTASFKTGVEMESLAGVTAALLCIWDMVKYLEKDEYGQYPTTSISDVKVVSKRKE
ncbi:MAG: cyclic pyranopterin monophosphate synthase MoaC [Thermoplasmata archaeon]|nr:MAG: cyclic pyranopterin monophosphate synthase MoaC [Thermoplasmata archaeon]